MTTSCFAHLSFLDGKGSSSMSRHDEEYDDDDERDTDGYVHELHCDDGKKKTDWLMDGEEWSHQWWKNGFKVAGGASIIGLTIPGSTQRYIKSKKLYLMPLLTY